MLANEMSIAGGSEAEVYAFVDKIINALLATVKSGLSMPEDHVLPGPIKLHSRAATVGAFTPYTAGLTGWVPMVQTVFSS